MILILGGGVIMGLLVSALCRAAARADRRLEESWAKRQQESEMEESWEHG